MIYPIDEVSDMDDISETVATLGKSVDWIIVRNRVRVPTTRFFDGSELEKQLNGYGAVSLELPGLLTDTRNHLRAHEVKLGRGLSPAEALKNPDIHMDLMHQVILEDWLKILFSRYDAIASHLLPNERARTIAAPATTTTVTKQLKRGATINLENAL